MSQSEDCIQTVIASTTNEDPQIVIEQIRAAIVDGLHKPGEGIGRTVWIASNSALASTGLNKNAIAP